MATSLTLQNDASLAQGYIQVNGTTSATFTTSGITGNLTGNVTGSLTAGGSLTLATAQTASGTAVDFTGIPSWAKRITVIFQQVVNSGSSSPSEIRVGTSSGIVSSGYNSSAIYTFPTNNVLGSNSSTGFVISGSNNTAAYTGTMVLTNISGNTWIQSGVNGYFAAAVSNQTFGLIVLSGVLDRIRFTVPVGTLTSGTINISYEG